MKRDANDVLQAEGIDGVRAMHDRAQKFNGNGKGPVGSLIQMSGQFVKGFVPPDYVLDGLLQRRFLYSLTARTGGGKTATVLLIAAVVALGKTIGKLEVTQGRVLYFAGENPDDVRMRWIAMAQTHGLRHRHYSGLLHPRSVQDFRDARAHPAGGAGDRRGGAGGDRYQRGLFRGR